MSLIHSLSNKWKDIDTPFYISKNKRLFFKDIISQDNNYLSKIKKGDVVALIGDFTPDNILTFLKLIDKGVIIVPLTEETEQQHDYFFESALVDFIIKGTKIIRRKHTQK